MRSHRNKLISTAALIIVLALMTAAFAGCSGTGASETTAPAASSEPTETTTAAESTSTEAATETETEAIESTGLKLTDMKGRDFELDGPATKIVALTAADCEIIYAVGAGDTLVGRGEYCNYPEEVLDIPAVQSGSETNIEQIIALEPDVVIMGTMDQSLEQIEALEQAGFLVVVTDAQDVDGIYESITLIGGVTGRDSEAAKLNEDIQSELARISEMAAENKSEEQKSVYFEVSPLEWGLWAAGNGTFMNELAEMIGLENSFSDFEQWGEISQEQVIERDPDYIVTIAMYFGEGPRPEEEIMSRPGWSDITAVKEQQVFSADSDELSRPGPRIVEGISSLYEFVYGEG